MKRKKEIWETVTETVLESVRAEGRSHTAIITGSGWTSVPIPFSKFSQCVAGDKVKLYCHNFVEIVGVEIVGKFKFIHTKKTLASQQVSAREARLAFLSNHSSPMLRSLAKELKR